MQTAESVFLPRDVFESLYLNPERNVPSKLRRTVSVPLLSKEVATDYATVRQSYPCSVDRVRHVSDPLCSIEYGLERCRWLGWWHHVSSLPQLMSESLTVASQTNHDIFRRNASDPGSDSRMDPRQHVFHVPVLHLRNILDRRRNTTHAVLRCWSSVFADRRFLRRDGDAVVLCNCWYALRCLETILNGRLHLFPGFYYLSLCMLTCIFCVCSLRTNLVFFSALFTLIFAFGCAAGAYWNLALGNVAAGGRLTVVSDSLHVRRCGSLRHSQYCRLVIRANKSVRRLELSRLLSR